MRTLTKAVQLYGKVTVTRVIHRIVEENLPALSMEEFFVYASDERYRIFVEGSSVKQSEKVLPEELMPRHVSSGMSTLKQNGGPLTSQYDSDKWEFPYGNRKPQRNWKSQRATQYKN